MILALSLALQAPPYGDALSRVIADLRDRCAPAVVSILVDRRTDPEGTAPSGNLPREYTNRPAGPCSGTILEPDGWIVTSHFNVSGELRRILVTLADGREIAAELRGYDKRLDIALLKIDATGLPVLPHADLSTLAQGSFAVALGRSPEPAVATANLGIVSALHRFGDTALQTDALLNYGNVGGPVVTLDGRLAAVSCRIKPGTNWGQSGGVGMATKIDEILAALPRLKEGMRREGESRAALGLMPADAGNDGGVRVVEVVSGSPAERAGLQADDVIVALDGEPVRNAADLRRKIQDHEVGDDVVIRFRRGDEEHETHATLWEAPQ